MIAEDGKLLITDIADTEQLFRLIQSISFPKAEPFKLWIAKTARERIDEITKAWSVFSVKDYKKYKDLKKENLRDNMINLELVLNILAEATTTEISKEKKPKTFSENKKIASQRGTIAGNTRKEIEEKTGKKVVSELS